jgi:hypothetical protein
MAENMYKKRSFSYMTTTALCVREMRRVVMGQGSDGLGGGGFGHGQLSVWVSSGASRRKARG